MQKVEESDAAESNQSLSDRLASRIDEGVRDSFELYRSKGYLGHSRPLLPMRRVQDMKDLSPFLRHLSRHAYFSMVDQETADTCVIEDILTHDFLEA
jgi:hypothetical protein